MVEQINGSPDAQELSGGEGKMEALKEAKLTIQRHLDDLEKWTEKLKSYQRELEDLENKGVHINMELIGVPGSEGTISYEGGIYTHLGILENGLKKVLSIIEDDIQKGKPRREINVKLRGFGGA